MEKILFEISKNNMGEKRRIISILNRRTIGAILFYIGITLELLFVLYDKSALHSLNTGLLFRVTFLLFAVKVLMTQYTFKEWCWMIGLGIVGYISYKCSGRNDMLRLVVMCAAFKEVDYKKVKRYTFYVMLSGCLLIFGMAILGIFGEMSMTAVFRMGQVATRYTFGFGHPNQMHCMFWIVSTLGVYCFWEKVNWIILSGLMVANVVIFLFTDSRGGLIGITCTVFVSLLLKYAKGVRGKKWPYVLVSVCLVLVGIFSVFIAYFGLIYHTDYPAIWYNQWFAKFYLLDDKFLSGRLWSCYGLLTTDMRNFGLFSNPANQEFMDMGFYKLFYWYGYIPAILYLVAHILLLRYADKNKDSALLMMVASFSAYTFLEAHLISPYLGRNYLLFVMGGLWSEILLAQDGTPLGWWNIPGVLMKKSKNGSEK
ncbi:MAG: hypothetical protein SOW50_08295 [Lachnospiraceae bacterium]|nr:hypothetical protein [Lachnospiraceae bacterium]